MGKWKVGVPFFWAIWWFVSPILTPGGELRSVEWWYELEVAWEVDDYGEEWNAAWCISTTTASMAWLSILGMNILKESLLLCIQEIWPLFQHNCTWLVRILDVCSKFNLGPINWKQWILFLWKHEKLWNNPDNFIIWYHPQQLCQNFEPSNWTCDSVLV